MKLSLDALSNCHLCLLGFGLENQALLDYLLSVEHRSKISIIDSRAARDLSAAMQKYKQFKQVQFCLETQTIPSDADYLFRSPGWPLFEAHIKKAIHQGAIVSSPMALFFDLCPTKNIIGVSGSKGKGTTASLLAAMLKIGGYNTYLGGNIGVAPFSFMSDIKKNDWVVLELSSFQLEDLGRSPRIAVMTNLSKEHLAPADPRNPNFHKTLKSYWLAKSELFCHQDKSGVLIANPSLKSRIRSMEVVGRVVYFSPYQGHMQLIGDHNFMNAGAAACAAKFAGVSEKNIREAVESFKGLEHRLEKVAVRGGVTYYDDSFATTPEASITALRAFENKGLVLLAGGAEKKSDFRELAQEIAKRVKYLVLFDGDASPRLKEAVLAAGFPADSIKTASSMPVAVAKATLSAQVGEVVLLSTACASFGIFKNYKERGDLFKLEVSKICP